MALLCTLPVIVPSIMIGEWGLNILIVLLHPSRPELKLKHKFAMIQLILGAVKFQLIIASQILKAVHVEEPGFPETPRVWMNSKDLHNVVFHLQHYITNTL